MPPIIRSGGIKRQAVLYDTECHSPITAAKQLGDLDWSITQGELIDNITRLERLVISYFYSYHDPTWNYLLEEKTVLSMFSWTGMYILMVSLFLLYSICHFCVTCEA